jgi:hypothetical protein
MLAKLRTPTEVPTSATPWLIGQLVNDILRLMRVATGDTRRHAHAPAHVARRAREWLFRAPDDGFSVQPDRRRGKCEFAILSSGAKPMSSY